MGKDVQIFVLSNDSHDRTRIMAPIGELKDLGTKVLQQQLEADCDRAGQAGAAAGDGDYEPRRQ
jgi:hypothetical protein